MSSQTNPKSEKTEPTEEAKNHQDLEVKDAQLIFNAVWGELVDKYGLENLRFPKELILLGGAPGAGKGTNTPFIMEARGLTCEPIVVSSLLNTPEMRKIKESGGLVGDKEVIQILLEKLLEPQFKDGAILDGFPRTFVQVECMKRLHDKMLQQRRDFYNTEYRKYFRQPIVHIMMLFIDEKESVARQLKRGQEALKQLEDDKAAGKAVEGDARSTDLSESSARGRYRVFKELTYDALQSLREIFHYHFIDAGGPLREVRQNIVNELEYQSTLELDPITFDALREIPIASRILEHARQDLVNRLDGYVINNPYLFGKVVQFIQDSIMPIVMNHAISGIAQINTENKVLEDPLAMHMFIDIFSERGYQANIDLHKIQVPDSVDLNTGKITCKMKKVWRLQIRFKGSVIRRG
ncbi:nucleoside monophosphate kinase [Puniceicoccaceae bacterium K14]|nr:nucleoside monophosphate kinase [Puniceicoccaceae bacterium K14]